MAQNQPIRFAHISGADIPATANSAADYCSIEGSITCTSLKLRQCSFTSNWTITCTDLYVDYETFQNLIAANVTLAVTNFHPMFSRWVLQFVASGSVLNSYLLPIGGVPAGANATQSNGQVQMPDSYIVIGMTGRTLTQPCTMQPVVGALVQTMSVSPTASGNAKDFAFGHWFKGNQYDLVSVQITALPSGAGGTTRGGLEVVLL
jgi:hypothetical protein